MMTEVEAADSVQEQPKLSRVSMRASGHQRRLGFLALLVAALVSAGCNGALPTPSRDVNQGQMMLDLTEALNAIRDQSASLQDQVDSLRGVIVRQDTVLRQLALNAGIPMPVEK